jgi:hypothetical protein
MMGPGVSRARTLGNTHDRDSVVPVMKFIPALDGSFIGVDHIARLFFRENVTRGVWEVCASVVGPQQPFVLHQTASSESARTLIKHLIEQIGG